MCPCEVEITGVAGSLQIYGCETALFLAIDDGGNSIVLRVHNCLFSYGEFSLISVSQLYGKRHNGVNLAVESTSLQLTTSEEKRRAVTIPLFCDEGLYGVFFEPLQVDDPRYGFLPKCEVTPARWEFRLQ
jgi:hypothetical protein